MKQINSLAFATNAFGVIKPDIKRRIEKFINNPTVAGWDDIFCIIIKGERLITIWQAVIEMDNTFPKVGRCEDMKGNVVEDWRKIPTPQQVIKAINNIVFNPSLN